MPNEYISREAAIEEIDKWLDTVGTALVGKGLSYYGELIGCIEDARAADVAQVRHGRWIHTDLAAHWLGKDECSECTYHEKDRSDLSHNNYCPNCGAKMDGATE